jgi:hypothetical protein
MVTYGGKPFGQTFKNTPVVMLYQRLFAVHYPVCLSDNPPVGMPDALVTQTYTEDRQSGAEMADNVIGHPCLKG